MAVLKENPTWTNPTYQDIFTLVYTRKKKGFWENVRLKRYSALSGPHPYPEFGAFNPFYPPELSFDAKFDTLFGDKIYENS